MVPSGWTKTTFDSLIDILVGFSFKSDQYTENSNDILLLRGDNIEPGALRWKNAKRWPCDKIQNLQKYQLIKGDFVIAMDRTWITSGLKVAEVTEKDLPCLLVQRVARIRANNKLDQRLLTHYFSSYQFEQYVKSVQLATAVPHISSNNIKNFPILLAPIQEQQKIAEILSTWDKAITSTENLIANSEMQKKALMQQLLTGKKRLLDENGVRFSGEWNIYTLDTLFTFKRGKGLSKADIQIDGKYQCILYGELYTTYPEVIYQVKSHTNKTDSILSHKGDILIPSSTTTSGIDLANATALMLDDVLLGGDINILRAKTTLNSYFIAHILTHIKKYEIASRAQGITIIHLYGNDLKDLKISIPKECDEQNKIAEVLSNADREIELLKAKLEHLKQEKKALMQQLLTGKRRVVIN